MRSLLSLVSLLSIAFSMAGPAFGQRSMRLSSKNQEIESGVFDGAVPVNGKGLVVPKTRQVKKRSEAVFSEVASFTEGKGAWIRWQMERESGNVGFRVYRIGDSGRTPVSDFVLSSAYKFPGDEPLTGSNYHVFDPQGSQGSTYFIEAIGEDGKSSRTRHIGTELIPTIDNLPGGEKMKTETFAAKAGENLVSEQMHVSSELAAEMQVGQLVANPTRHREVISTVGAVRIGSRADGLIRVTKTELQNGGFDVNSDPANWQLYLEGTELPLIIGPNADYIEFLGKSIDTLASDIRSYYLINGGTAGKRIATQVARPPLTSVTSRKYNQTFAREERTLYISTILNGVAENWFGAAITPGGTNYNFTLSGIDRTEGTRKMTLNLQGLTAVAHTVQLTLNGQALPNMTGSGIAPFQAVIDVPVSALLDGQNTLVMKGVASGSDFSLIDRISIEFPRNYVAINNKLNFYTENYKNATVSGFTSSNIRVFDVTFESTPRVLTNLNFVQTNGTWGPVIPAGRNRVLYAVEAGVYGTAVSVSPVDPSLLGEASNAGTFVVISHPSLMSQANDWAAYRSSKGTLTKVIDVNEIYDEFNYGVISSQAIEDFLSYAKNNWATPPSYVLLIGDGHYDPRNYDQFDLGYWNLIPSRLVDTRYEETGSDDALSDFNNDGLAEIPVGRIAARTGADVTTALNRTITWENSVSPTVMNRGVIFAYDRPNGYNFKAMSGRVMSNLPPEVPRTTVAEANCTNDLDVTTCTANPTANTELLTAITAPDGKYVLNYTGHGAGGFWSRETFFDEEDAAAVTNAAHPLLVTALTCLNGYFMSDEPTNLTLAEAFIRSNVGGAAAVWASTGKTTPDVQELMATRFFVKVSEGSIPRLGDLVNDAKAQVPSGADVRLSWALHGDPMLLVR